jgi:TIR domain
MWCHREMGINATSVRVGRYMVSSIEVFLCYAHEDEEAMKELAIHLGVLRRQGILKMWHEREIIAGTEWAQEIEVHLNAAKLIVLLVSQYFMNSDYCYCIGMARAIERHLKGEARVIPVILRPVYYKKAPFAKLQPLPMNRKPVLSWLNLDEAFFDVAEGIRLAIEDLTSSPLLLLNNDIDESRQL